MRGVPHTLGMQVSLAADTTLTNPPADMTGWSGDVAPQTGSLSDFAIGAVTQHFTRRLDRIRGRDFKLPNEHQLDAMEAFQLSLGRTADFNLAAITFNDTNVNTGKSLFINGTGGGTCAFCRGNAGALAATPPNQNLQTAFDETQDAIDVLGDGGLFPFAVTRLTTARSRIAHAQHTNDRNRRRTLVQQAITELAGARTNIATP